ncbi:MAG: (2Fe-2S) ferredoxin domain-containing protein [Rhodobacterales bacterium]|nr:(2Fe-2S) ferredoxin domain-containing protein [Rhodobacterales bacterium]
MTDAAGPTLLVCINRRPGAHRPSCGARGSERLADLLEDGLAARGVALPVERIRCLGRCDDGPTVRLSPGGDFFLGADTADLAALLDRVIDGWQRLEARP